MSTSITFYNFSVSFLMAKVGSLLLWITGIYLLQFYSVLCMLRVVHGSISRTWSLPVLSLLPVPLVTRWFATLWGGHRFSDQALTTGRAFGCYYPWRQAIQWSILPQFFDLYSSLLHCELFTILDICAAHQCDVLVNVVILRGFGA